MQTIRAALASLLLSFALTACNTTTQANRDSQPVAIGGLDGLTVASATEPAQTNHHWLLTPQEAAQPKTRTLVTAKSDPGGPKVVIQHPAIAAKVKSPVSIDVLFEAQGGRQLDMKSLKVTYISLFDIDITDRLADYLTTTGIHADDAELPPGEHTIEILIKDQAGRRSVEHLNFRVMEN